MTAKSKPNIRERIEIVHICTQVETLKRQEELLSRLGLVTLGNGNPENGLLFMFRIFLEEDKKRQNDIAEIKTAVKESIESSLKTAKILALYKAEMHGVEIGAAKKSAKMKLKFDTVTNIIGTMIVLLGLFIAFLEFKKETVVTRDKIENLGTPVIINSRGLPAVLPTGDSLKFFRNGQLKDTMR
jgi:hypothetical protein